MRAQNFVYVLVWDCSISSNVPFSCRVLYARLGGRCQQLLKHCLANPAVVRFSAGFSQRRHDLSYLRQIRTITAYRSFVEEMAEALGEHRS